MSMRPTSFGAMARLLFPARIMPGFEVMHFTVKGKPHVHSAVEFAVAVVGSGTVWIDGIAYHVKAGDEVLAIPSGALHYMEPDEGQALAMLIAYEAAT